MRRAVVLALVVLPLAAGCGSGDKPAASVGEGVCAPLGHGMGPLSGGKPSGTMLLSALDTAREPCADRVQLDFRKDLAEVPGYRVEYRPADEAQTEDGSGKHLGVEGKAFLVVRLEPAATADLTKTPLEITYAGPRRVPGDDTTYVSEVVKTGDFEAVLRWTIGLTEKRPFTVIESASPPRLTIEIG
jgi:hypothetical protein